MQTKRFFKLAHDIEFCFRIGDCGVNFVAGSRELAAAIDEYGPLFEVIFPGFIIAVTVKVVSQGELYGSRIPTTRLVNIFNTL